MKGAKWILPIILFLPFIIGLIDMNFWFWFDKTFTYLDWTANRIGMASGLVMLGLLILFLTYIHSEP